MSGNETGGALLAAVLITSLVGSLHCAGMCGVFVAMATGASRRGRWRLQTLYHTGRLVGYGALGVASGAMGRALDLGGSAVGFSGLAAIMAAVTILLIGVATLGKEFGLRLPRTRSPRWAQRIFERGVRSAGALSASKRAGIIGLFTVLLPCGWLYAFVILAAGTASPGMGALVMATFWLGTVPVLTVVGFGAGALRARLGPRARVAAGALVMLIGVWTLGRATGADLNGVRAAMGADARGAVVAPASATPESAMGADCPLCHAAEEK